MFDELKEVTQFQSLIVIFIPFQSISLFHQLCLLSAFRSLDLKRVIRLVMGRGVHLCTGLSLICPVWGLV